MGGSPRRSRSATTRRAAITRSSRRTPAERADVAGFVAWLADEAARELGQRHGADDRRARAGAQNAAPIRGGREA